MWSIHSMGDAAFLEQIFISVAMVVGSGDFMKAASIAMLVGVLIMFLQSLAKDGRGFNLGAVLLGWILFMIMFVPKTTVVIEDNVSGSVRVVSNVPVGVAASGSIISSIGYGLTDLFEQGYAFIGSGSLGSKKFAEPLKILNTARANGNNPNLMVALNNATGPGTDYRTSWENYVRECTVRKVQNGSVTADEIMNSPMPEALRTDSNISMTQIVIRGNPQTLTCTEAFNTLSAEFRGAMASFEYQNALAKALSSEGYEVDPYASISGDSLLNQALNDMGLGMTNAQNYMMGSILQPLYLKGVQGFYEDVHAFTKAVTLNQAIAQRNTQWSMEASVFMTVIRPLQTFFEGFVYAVTPILAMLIVTGSFGFSMAGKYLMLLFWVQLWLPLLSIINLYILTVASGDLAAINDATLSSMYALDDTASVLQNWISTGGMLAASVPMIALFLVSGSTYALTNIAGKVNGADHIDEKISNPDVATNAPVMQQQAMNTANAATGVSKTGTNSLTGNMTLGKTAQSAISSAEQHMESAQQSFSNTMTRAMSEGGSHSASSAVNSALNRAYSSSHGEQRHMIDSAAAKLSKETGMSHQEALTKTRSAAAGISGKAGVSGGAGAGATASAGIDASGRIASENRSTEEVTDRQALSALKDSGWSKADTADWQRSIASNLSNTNSDVYSHEQSDSLTQALASSSQDLLQSQRSYSQMQQFASSVGAQSSMSLEQVVGALHSTDTGQEQVRSMNDYFNQAATADMRSDASTRAGQLMRMNNWDYEKARDVARLETLMGGKQSTPDSMSFGANVVSQGLGMGKVSTPSTFNAKENAGLGDKTPVFGGAQSAVAAVANSPVGGGYIAMAHTNANNIDSPNLDRSNDNNALVGQDVDRQTTSIENARDGFYSDAQEKWQKQALDDQAKAHSLNDTWVTRAWGNYEKTVNGAYNILGWGGSSGIPSDKFEDIKSSLMGAGVTDAQSSYMANHFRGDTSALEANRQSVIAEMGQENAQSFFKLVDESAKGDISDFYKAGQAVGAANKNFFG